MPRCSVRKGIDPASFSLAATSIAAMQPAGALESMPHAGVTLCDTIETTGDIGRRQNSMFLATLFRADGNFIASPQMAASMAVADDGVGLVWRGAAGKPAARYRPVGQALGAPPNARMLQ